MRRPPLVFAMLLAATVLVSMPSPAQRSSPGSNDRDFAWKRSPHNPVIPATAGTWRESQTANPDLLLNGDTYYMYFRGQSGGHDRIGVATIPREKFDGVTWDYHPKPVIDIGAPGSWDEQHALDPAAILFHGKVFLYYTGSSPRSDRAICLAVSDDGITFTKYEHNPVTIGGGPEVVLRGDTLYLYFWREVPGKKGFQIHYAVSTDGFHFTEPGQSLALPVGAEGSWDSFTVETPRIFSENGLYYMVYCGSDRNKDYPFHAGLATSWDLVHWKKYDANPIFSRGEEGQWDEGAIWFTTVEKIGGRYYLWYEGYGGGTARTVPYGSYLKGGKSQIGMATMDAPFFYVKPMSVEIRVDDIYMSDTDIQPQEIDSFVTMLNRHGAKLQLAVIPHRLLEPQNADGRMRRDLQRFVAQGHMISLHGWNHRHQPTGNTGQEFQDVQSGAWVPYDSIITQLRLGKVMLEEITGGPVTTYVSPGTDDQLNPIVMKALYELNMRWVTNPHITEPVWADSINTIPDMPEYTWAIDSTTYAAMLDSAKTAFTLAVARGGYFPLCVHDHFTRYAWHNGILTRWVDELLTWIEHQPDIRVRYVTIDYMKPEHFMKR